MRRAAPRRRAPGPRARGAVLAVLVAGCYQSHELEDASTCSLTYRWADGEQAVCRVDSRPGDSCVQVARCLCERRPPEPPATSEHLTCVEALLELRALVTLGDFCSAEEPAPLSVVEAVERYAGAYGAEVSAASPSCRGVPALAPR